MPASTSRQFDGPGTLHAQGVRRRSSQIVPPPNATLEIRVDGPDSDSDDDDLFGRDAAKDTDALIARRASSTSVAAFHGSSRRASNSTLPAIGERRDASPLAGSYLLYTSVLITVMLGPQLGWEISQLNFRAFHNSKDCAQTPVQPGKCTIFPGHSDTEWVAAVMCWILGASIGSLFANAPAEKYGRRAVVISNACLMIVGAALQTFAPNIFVFALGRLLSGVASGSGTVIASLYLGEIGPPHQRAGFVIAFQCGGSIGIVSITSVHFAVTGSATAWRWIMAFPIVLGVIQLLLAPLFLIESPKWLLRQNRHRDAASAFHALYQTGSFQDLERTVKAEQEKIHRRELAQLEDVHAAGGKSFWRDATSSRCRRQFAIACILCAARQFGGVTAVFYYSSGIFAGAGIDDSRVGNLVLALVNMSTALTVCACSTKLARRRVLLCGIGGMIVCSIGMTISLVYRHAVSIAFTALYVMSNALSLGPLPFLVTAEVLPEDIKARGMSITTFINWFSNLLVGVGFPVLAHYTGSYTFVPFTCLLVCFWVSVYVMLPETRGKTHEQIQQEFAASVGFLASLKKFKKLDDSNVCDGNAMNSSSKSTSCSAAMAASEETLEHGHAAPASSAASIVPMRGPRRASVDLVMPTAATALTGSRPA